MILIVDDDAGIRSSLKFILTHSGKYNVLTASNGEEAIEIVRKNSLRLIITDMNFSSDTSGRDGLELLQKVKILSPQTPVILITAWSSIPLAVTGIKLGATDFISKPWDNRQLLDKIDSIMTTAGKPQDFDRCGIIGNNSQLENIHLVIGLSSKIKCSLRAIISMCRVGRFIEPVDCEKGTQLKPNSVSLIISAVLCQLS